MRDARPETVAAYLSERADLYGGGQRSLCDLLRALRGTRIRPLAVIPGPGPLSESLDRQGTEWVALPLPPVLSLAGCAALSTLARLQRLVRARGVGLLHSDSPRTALYAGLCARLLGRRHVFHVRSSRASSGAADRLLVALSDRVIAVSRAAASRSRAVRLSRRTRVVATGLAPTDVLPRREARLALDLPQEAFVLGVVGRVEADKGRDEALAALAVARRVVPGALLVYLGPIDPRDPWHHTCALRAAAHGMAGAVRIAGPRPEAARLLGAFDALLHPSRHEALPRVIIEALLAGVPVVASAVGGVVEIIDSGINGLLVPPRNADALGRAAAQLALDPAKGRRLAEAGRARARERFAIERMAEEIMAIYEEILPQPPGAITSRSPRTGGRAGEATP